MREQLEGNLMNEQSHSESGDLHKLKVMTSIFISCIPEKTPVSFASPGRFDKLKERNSEYFIILRTQYV